MLEKLSIFSNELKLRNKVANYYSKNITSDLIKPFVPKDYLSSWAQYSLMTRSESEKDRIIKSLSASGIPFNIYYKLPLHLQKVFNSLGYVKGSFPIAEKTSKTIFSIPMHPYLSIEDQNRIVEVLNNF